MEPCSSIRENRCTVAEADGCWVEVREAAEGLSGHLRIDVEHTEDDFALVLSGYVSRDED